MLKQQEQQDLCQAVAGWLSYKSLTGLEGHLNESSMSVPIAEFLTTRHAGDIKSEVDHPVFEKKKGRPKQLDFVQKNFKGPLWKAVYECKYQSDTPERLIDDICRLLTLNQADEVGRPNRYFVFAGRREEANKPLDRLIHSGNGGKNISVFERILLRGVNDRDDYNLVRICDLHSRQKVLFRSFSRQNNIPIPLSFVTELRGIAISGHYSCAVWQIKSASNSPPRNFDEIIAT